jgi:hypothetical protein
MSQKSAQCHTMSYSHTCPRGECLAMQKVLYRRGRHGNVLLSLAPRTVGVACVAALRCDVFSRVRAMLG